MVVGLLVFLALSRSGPLGSWGLLFTPQAMVIAQTLLVAPIIAALARQTIEDLWVEYRDELTAMIEQQGEAEVTCEFCREPYHFDRTDLERLLAELGTGTA